MAEKDGKEKKPASYMCMVSGHIAIGKVPAKCPECGAAKENFRRVA